MSYIDTQYLFKCETCRHCIGEYKCDTFCDSGECYSPNMVKIPTADVVEVRHGKWLMPLTDEPWRRGYFCRCSVCKRINHGHTENVPDFCESCGAKMDGERKEQ